MDTELFTLMIIGTVLIFSTYLYAFRSGKGMTLWAGIEPQYQLYYTISGVFAGLVFIYLFWYYVFYREHKTENFRAFVSVAMGFIIYGSAAWVPLTFLGLSNPNYKILSVIALFFVSIGSILLIAATASEENSIDEWDTRKYVDHGIEWKLAIASASIFAFHVTILDLLSWGSSYLAK